VVFVHMVAPRAVVRAITAVAVLAEIGLAAALLHQVASGTNVYWFGGWVPHGGVPLGISFTIDRIGAGGALLAGIVAAAAFAVLGVGEEADGIVHALLLALLGAMAGFCLTGDLFNMFVFFELMAVCAFGLAAYHTQSLTALRSALSFAITNSIGAFLVLIAIALLYGRTGALNLAEIGRQLATHPGSDRLVTIALALLVVGFLIKAAVVPFHFWLVDTVSGAPLALVIILAGVLDALGVYGVARVYWTVFASATGHQALGALLVVIGAGSALGAGALSLAFRHPRRRLAFVMVAHTGILLVGAGCLSAAGVAGAALYAVGDGTVKAALFIGLALLGFDGPADAPRRAAGRGRRRVGVSLLAAGGIATAGLPVFATGVGKAVIEDAASRAGYLWASPCIVVAAALTGAAVLELAVTAAAGGDGALAGTGDVPLFLGFVGVALLSVSALAASVGRWASRAAASFVDDAAYRQRVLGGAHVPPVAPPHVGLSAAGAALDLVAVGLALALAFGRARATRPLLPTKVVAGARRVAGRAHDGSIGDSATWATIGTATITVVLAASMR
jgi:multicomponent Na+:H+ antiporter subunit D